MECLPLSPSPVKKPIVSYDELPEDDFDLYDVDLFLKVGESNGYEARMADLLAVSVDGLHIHFVPLFGSLGATQDMAKVLEWMLRDFLLANLRGAHRVDKSRISSTPASRIKNMGKTEYMSVPKGGFKRRASAGTRTCGAQSSTCWSGCDHASYNEETFSDVPRIHPSQPCRGPFYGYLYFSLMGGVCYWTAKRWLRGTCRDQGRVGLRRTGERCRRCVIAPKFASGPAGQAGRREPRLSHADLEHKASISQHAWKSNKSLYLAPASCL